MKNITSIYHRTFAFAYVLLVAVLLSSCSDLFPTDEQFIVIKVESTKRGEYKYQMSSIKGKGGFFMKSETLYQKGDTLVLCLNCR